MYKDSKAIGILSGVFLVLGCLFIDSAPHKATALFAISIWMLLTAILALIDTTKN